MPRSAYCRLAEPGFLDFENDASSYERRMHPAGHFAIHERGILSLAAQRHGLDAPRLSRVKDTDIRRAPGAQ